MGTWIRFHIHLPIFVVVVVHFFKSSSLLRNEKNYNKNIVKKKNGRNHSEKKQKHQRSESDGAARRIINKSQPEMIRCAEITHEKKTRTINNQIGLEMWRAEPRPVSIDARAAQSTLPMTFRSPSLLSMFASLFRLRAPRVDFEVGKYCVWSAEEIKLPERKVKADTILIRASFLLARRRRCRIHWSAVETIKLLIKCRW